MNKAVKTGVAGLAACVLLFLASSPSLAATSARIDQKQLRKLVLTLPEIDAAAQTGFTAQSQGIDCTSAKLKATICLQKGLESESARAAKTVRVTWLNVLSFRTVSEAKKYVATLASQRPVVLSKSASQAVLLNPSAVIGVDPRFEVAREVTVARLTGATAVLAACANPAAGADVPTLEACAKAVATAQVKKLQRG